MLTFENVSLRQTLRKAKKKKKCDTVIPHFFQERRKEGRVQKIMVHYIVPPPPLKMILRIFLGFVFAKGGYDSPYLNRNLRKGKGYH